MNINHYLVILVTVAHFTLPTYLPKQGDNFVSPSCSGDSTVVDTSIAKVNLYQAARYGNGIFYFQRFHLVTQTQADTFNLYDAVPGYTYSIEVEDRAGNKSCTSHIAAGIPTVGVSNPPIPITQFNLEKQKLYAVTGSRVRFPLSSGIYYSREIGRFIILDGKVLRVNQP